jgi:hypothetical protein
MDHLPVDNKSRQQLWNLSQNKDWDNGQLEHTWDWDCLTMHTFGPCPQFFCLLKPIAHVCTPKMAEDELSAYYVSSHSVSPVM